MKLYLKLIIALVMISIIPMVAMSEMYLYMFENQVDKQVSDQIEESGWLKANIVTMYLQERKNDAIAIADSDSVNKILNEAIMADSENAKKRIREQSESIAEEVGNYIMSHPGMTVRDLQEDESFQKIAVQKVGETGYSAVTDTNTLVNRFHANEKIVDTNLESLSEKLPEFWSIMSKTKGGNAAEGFYYWIEADGTIEKKYMHISVVDAKTADGVQFNVAATTYISEFPTSIQLIGESEEYLKNFQNNYNFKDLLIINYQGVVIWESHGNEEIGLDLSSAEMNGTSLASGFRLAKSNGEAAVTDYSYYKTDNSIASFAISPIIDDNQFLGIVALIINRTEIDNIMEDRTGLGETGETFLVGRDYLMRSNSRYFNYSTILKVRAYTENTRMCYEHADMGIGMTKGVHFLKSFKDYRGIMVSGSHVYIDQMDYCLIIKIDDSELYQPIKNARWISIILYSIILALSIVVSISISKNFTNPIKDLTHFTKEIGKGNFKARINIKSRDEIGQLSNGMNRMAHELDAYEQQSKRFSRTLEKKVVMKTNDLQKSEQAAYNIMEDLNETTKELREQKRNVEQKVKERTKELEKAYNELKKFDDAKEEFISIVSHELKSPLFPIMGYTELMLNDKIGKLTKEQKDKMIIVYNNALNINRLIEDMLTLSRLELNKLTLQTDKFNMVAIAKEVKEELKTIADKDKVAITISGYSKVNAEVDKFRFQQVLRNLILNSIFNKKGSSGKVNIDIAKDKNNAIITISDNGKGIPKDDMPKLFSRFYQAEKSASRTHEGTGLGLPITKGLVELHGGKLTIESKEGKGTTIIIIVPLERRK